MLMKNICKDSQAKLTNCFNFQNIISKTNETKCFWEKVMFLHCYFLVFVAYTLDFIRLTWQAIRVFTTQDKIKLFEHVKLFSTFVN